MIQFEVKKFEDINNIELYDILRLRAEVFVVEQDCVYQDIDGKDNNALHIIGRKNGKVIAYSRIFNSGDYFDLPSIGRVVVDKEERQHGYGHDLIEASIKAVDKWFNKGKIKISAQLYLKKFYESHGFIMKGEEYLEDGIPHIGMIRDSN